ncbi:HAMP domain-containing histidine kinase [Blautia schinkii]|nr:HAMP domain-containing histidine kinase [Blautia schinkii]
MIKTLQKKFILTAMAAVTVLLLFMLGAINGINYWMAESQTEHTLEMLSENDGQFPPQQEPLGGRPDFFPPRSDREFTMAARFFLVHLDALGKIMHIDISQIASVNETEAEQLALEVLERETTSGSIDQFKYKISPSGAGNGTVMVFLDTSTQLNSLLMVLAISVCIGLVCWLLMLLLVFLLSKKAIKPIALSLEKQKQFVTNAGHEIKTPLAIILANTDALELHKGESKWSRNIRTQTIRLNGLMQNLLTLSKMEEGTAKLQGDDFCASRLLEETLHPYYEMAALNHVSIQAEIQPEIMLHADQGHITQLFSILFDNAVKYTNPGGQITVTFQKPDKSAVLQVKNTCTALPEGEPEKLFDRFYRDDSARTQKSGGYGIGLSVAKAIAESCKGSIRAAYEEGSVVCFTVRL